MFDNDWLEFVNRAKAFGIVVPPPDEATPVDFAPLESTEIQEEPHYPSGDVAVEVMDDHRGYGG